MVEQDFLLRCLPSWLRSRGTSAGWSARQWEAPSLLLPMHFLGGWQPVEPSTWLYYSFILRQTKFVQELARKLKNGFLCWRQNRCTPTFCMWVVILHICFLWWSQGLCQETWRAISGTARGTLSFCCGCLQRPESVSAQTGACWRNVDYMWDCGLEPGCVWTTGPSRNASCGIKPSILLVL